MAFLDARRGVFPQVRPRLSVANFPARGRRFGGPHGHDHEFRIPDSHDVGFAQLSFVGDTPSVDERAVRRAKISHE
jgi:hypothetical protein